MTSAGVQPYSVPKLDAGIEIEPFVHHVESKDPEAESFEIVKVWRSGATSTLNGGNFHRNSILIAIPTSNEPSHQTK